MKQAPNAQKCGNPLLAAAIFLPVSLATTATIAADDGFDIPGEFSANVALTTDYRFRGITQSSNDPALQGGIDYSIGVTEAVSLYAGLWGSNVDFNDGDQASVEVDYYAGVTTEIQGVGIDVGVIYYSYPGASSGLDYDYFEGKIALGYSPIESVSFGIGYFFSPDYFGSSGTFHYPNAFVEFTPDLGLPLPVTLSATYGYSIIDDNAAFGADDYQDWSVGISTNYKIINLSLQYIDNDLDGPVGDPTVVFTVGASF